MVTDTGHQAIGKNKKVKFLFKKVCRNIMWKEIQIKNLLVKVDNSDYERLLKYKWIIVNGGYAATHVSEKGRKIRIYMHRLIMGVSERKKVVDHINGDTFDNRKLNLRVCTQSENSRNRKVRNDSKSLYKGVKAYKNRFIATIVHNKKAIRIGTFESAEDAARYYNFYANKFFGEFAKLNKVNPIFPENGEALSYAASKSGYRGVYKSANGNFYARIKINGKSFVIGTFESAEDAARNYNFYLKKHRVGRLLLNNVYPLFPDETNSELKIGRGKSKYKGVYSCNGKWASSIRKNNKRFFLGLFDTEEEAAIAYKNALIEFGTQKNNF